MEKVRLSVRRTAAGLFIAGEKASLAVMLPADSIITLSVFGPDVLRIYTVDEWREVLNRADTPEKRRMIVPVLQFTEPIRKTGHEILLSPELGERLPREELYYLELPGMGITGAARFILGEEKLTSVLRDVLRIHENR